VNVALGLCWFALDASQRWAAAFISLSCRVRRGTRDPLLACLSIALPFGVRNLSV
jgi:hypothetical protein